MSFNAIYQDQYATNQLSLDEDINYLTYLACGHLTHYLGSPASAATWNPEMANHIRGFLAAVATTNPKIKPSAVFRIILIIARYKTNNPGAIAYKDEAELFFYVTFASVAGLFDPSFTIETAISLLDSGWKGLEFVFRLYRAHVDDELKAEMAPSQKNLTAAKVLATMEFFLAPFVDAGLRRGFGGGLEMQCPSMATSTDLNPRVPSRREQKMLFSRIPWTMRKHLLLNSIDEEDEQEGEEGLEEVSLVDAINNYTSRSAASTSKLTPSPWREFVTNPTLSTSFATTTWNNSFFITFKSSSSSSTRPSLSTMSSRSSGSSVGLKPTPSSSSSAAGSSSMSRNPSLSFDVSSNVITNTSISTTSTFDLYPLRTPSPISSSSSSPPPPRHFDPLSLGFDSPFLSSEESMVSIIGNGDSSLFGGVMHMVATKLRLSRTAGRPSRIRRALFKVGLPVGMAEGARSRRW